MPLAFFEPPGGGARDWRRAELEHYDTVGAYRGTDNGYPVDGSGTSFGLTLHSGFEFEDGLELAAQLSESSRVRACVVDRGVRYASGGGSLAYDPCVREELEELAASPDVSLRDLVIAIAVHPKFAAGTADIYWSEREGATAAWSAPVLVEELNTPEHNDVIAQWRGDLVVMDSDRFGRRRDVLFARYPAPVAVLEPVTSIDSDADDRDGWLSVDGRRLYFVSDRSGSLEIYLGER